MTVEELEAIVAGEEGAQVEFKRSSGERSEAGKTVCGMLNGIGGFVFFGVRNDGTIEGQEVGSSTIEDIIVVLRRLDPRIPINPEVVRLANGRLVIALRVPGSNGGPFTYDGRPYLRQGPVTSVMSQEDYRNRLLEQMHPSHRWEVQGVHGIDVQDLDANEITRTIEEAIRRGRLSDPGTRDPLELLRGLDLIRGNSLTNAAVVLFVRAERALPGYPQCLLRLARFRGTTSAEFEDNRQFHGNIFELLQVAQSFLRQHLPVAGRIVPTLFEREDDPLYPPEALREALANALCHRDYSMGGGSVSIAVFDDRLEISSTGRLPFGLTVDDLLRPHASRPWNPMVASVLFRRGIIEQWGRGTLRIRELAERAGLNTPVFEERSGEVVVKFFPSGYVAPRRVDHPLTALQQEILQTLAQIGPSLLGELQAAMPTNPSSRPVQSALQTLRSLDLVDLAGFGRGARWHVKGRR